MSKPHPDEPLAPRVARLEGDIESITRDLGVLTKTVGDLAQSISHRTDEIYRRIEGLATQTNADIKQLMIGLEHAAAPKKADMNAVFAGIGVVITIAVLAFTPLWIEVGRGMERDKELRVAIDAHNSLELHPVGKAKIEMLAAQLTKETASNSQGIRDLDTKLQNEYQLVSAAIKEQVKAMNDSSVDRRAQSAKEIADLAHRIEKLEDYTNGVRELHGAQGERLRRIESDLNSLGFKRVTP